MSARFFFHAPDGRVYGPADFATLTRWRTDKRLDDGSRLRQELTETFLTYGELAANPPADPVAALPPVPIAPPTPPPSILAPPEFQAVLGDEEGPVFTLSELVRHGIHLYRRGFRTLWPVAAVIQVPILVFYGIALRGMVPAQNFQSVSLHQPGEKEMLLFLVIMLAGYACNSLGGGLLADLIVDLDQDNPPSLSKSLAVFRSRWGAQVRTWLLGCLIIFSWMIVGNLVAKGISFLPVPAVFQQLLSVIVFFPAVLFTLRYLISPQVAMLEKTGGLLALKRANDLVRYNFGNSPFSSGDLRLVVLLAAVFLATVSFTSLLSILMSAVPMKDLSVGLTIVLYLGIVTVTPLLSIFLTLFTLDGQRRLAALEKGSLEPRPPLETP